MEKSRCVTGGKQGGEENGGRVSPFFACLLIAGEKVSEDLLWHPFLHPATGIFSPEMQAWTGKLCCRSGFRTHEKREKSEIFCRFPWKKT